MGEIFHFYSLTTSPVWPSLFQGTHEIELVTRHIRNEVEIATLRTWKALRGRKEENDGPRAFCP